MEYRVLLDQNVPIGVRKLLQHPRVSTCFEMGWERLTNGELLDQCVYEGFGLVVTCDRNLVSQQSLEGRQIAVLVLSPGSWKVLREHGKAIRAAAERATRGEFTMVDLPIRPAAPEFS